MKHPVIPSHILCTIVMKTILLFRFELTFLHIYFFRVILFTQIFYQFQEY